MMHEREKSDRFTVPKKPSNKAERSAAEKAEGRSLAKGNPLRGDTNRMQSRSKVNSALRRIRQAAERDRKVRFTSLMHHIYSVDTLREAYFSLKREAAPGMDGETWRHYGLELEERLQDLSERLARGAYRASPAQRVYVPKADGRQRPIGVPVLEDKIVQRATVAVLNQVYETEFVGFSYGFRPGRGQHDALAALNTALVTKKVNHVLDADIRGFFDAISHEWTVKFVEHRIGDERVVGLIQKWLKAGVLEDGIWKQAEEGTPQGGSASPLLANIYLHYVFDLWVQQWRTKQAHGDGIVVRFCDDFIVGFQYRFDAELFLADLKERFLKFGLELHPEKTRLIEFGRYAASDRKLHKLGKPETFDFLGLTHICGITRSGKFTVQRKTIRKRLRTKLKEVRAELRRRLHDPIPEVGHWLRSVVNGHCRYYGVTGNYPSISRFRYEVAKSWYRVLRRRSQRVSLTWERMARLIKRWIPPARIYHPGRSMKQLQLGVQT